MAKMKDKELRTVTAQLYNAARSYVENTEVEAERETTLRFYKSRPYGDEKEGMSSFVTAEVLEAVTWILPGVNKKFTYSERACEFLATSDEEGLGGDRVRDMILDKISEEFAQDATDYCNDDFYKRNDGFKVFEAVSWDGMVSKTGVMKHWWAEKNEQTFRRFFELNADDVEALMLEDTPDNVEVEYTELRRYDGPEPNPLFDPEAEEGPDNRPMQQLVDIEVKKTAKTAGMRYESIAPEDFLVLPGDDYVHEDMRGCFERIHKARWQLLDMGIDEDVALSIPAWNVETEEMTIVREGYSTTGSSSADEWQDDVILIQAYVHVDQDGDGTNELRRVLCGGDGAQIFIESEAVSEIPYTDFCPFRIPHTFYGDCVADRVADLQRLSSENIRQQLDYGVEINTPTIILGKGAERKSGETIRDINERSTGGVIRAEDAMQIRWDRPPDISPLAEKIDRWVKQKTIARTGASEVQPASDPNSLQPGSATETIDRRQASDEIKDWIAASYADSMKRVFKRTLMLNVRHSTKPRTIRVGDHFKTIDARLLPPDLEVRVNVGLGSGTKQATMAYLGQIKQDQQQLVAVFGWADDNPAQGFVTRNQYFNACKDYVRAAGFDDPHRYYTDPTGKGEMQISPQILAEIQRKALEEAQQNVMVQLQKYAIDKQAATDIQEAMIKAQVEREKTAQKETDSRRDAQTDRFKVIEGEATERQAIAANITMGERPRMPR